MGTDQRHPSQIPEGVTTLLLTAFALPDEGGIQRSVHQVATALGRRVLVVAPPHEGGAMFDRSVAYQVYRRDILGGRQWPSWGWLVRWMWEARRSSARVVLFGHCSGACFAAPVFRLFGFRYSILVHGRDLLAERRRRSGWYFDWVLRHADWVGVNSSFVAKLVHEARVPYGRIVRTHPAVPDDLLRVPLGGRTHRIVTVSRLVWRKNVDTAIEAFAQLVAQDTELMFDIVGDGPERPALESLARKLKVFDRIVWHGHVSDARRDEILRQASVFVMAPRVGESGTDVEGLGLVYLEAAAYGLPIVASPTGGVTDIVVSGVTGACVHPESVTEMALAIRGFLADGLPMDAQKRRMWVEREFSWRTRNMRLQAYLGDLTADIGVVIPAWNAADTIGDTLRGLFAQTLLPANVVIVDDGSSDGLDAAIAPWRSRVTLIHQAQAGAAAARNRGAQEMSNEFIIFLDADIDLVPTALADMARVLVTHPEAAYVYPSFSFGPKAFHLHDFDASALRRMNYIHTSALMRRTAFPGFDPALKKFQDWDLWLTMLGQGAQGMWVQQKLFHVRQRRLGYSTWLPSIVYQLPFIGQGKGNAAIARYRAAEAIIRKKHGLQTD